MPELDEIPEFAVWRQDDNGTRVAIGRSYSRSAASQVVSVLEARGHRQTYWVERVGAAGAHGEPLLGAYPSLNVLGEWVAPAPTMRPPAPWLQIPSHRFSHARRFALPDGVLGAGSELGLGAMRLDRHVPLEDISHEFWAAIAAAYCDYNRERLWRTQAYGCDALGYVTLTGVSHVFVWHLLAEPQTLLQLTCEVFYLETGALAFDGESLARHLLATLRLEPDSLLTRPENAE